MDYSVTFARHFSRLVWLLLREPANTDEQKAALRALVTVSNDGEVTLALDGLEVIANGSARLGSLPAARELALRLVGHEVGELHAAASATAADLLNAARVLAEEPTFGSDGVSAAERLVATGAQSVWFLAGVTRPQQDALRGPQQPPAGSPPPSSRREPPGGSSRGKAGRKSGSHAANSPQELLRRLEGARGDAAARALEELVALAEGAVREGKPHIAAAAFAALVRRESTIADEQQRQPYAVAIRRLSMPQLLREIAALLLREREWSADCVAILVRAGVEGADAIIEQLTKAQTTDDRRMLFDILVKLRAGISSLLLMLGDARWYVVRNAAEILGEMKATEAQGALIPLLRHGDERVRRAVVNALLQLNTPVAVRAVQRALSDSANAAHVRQEAAQALGRRRGERTSVTTLVRALDSEDEEPVQFSILAALGKVATPEAVERLIAAAEPERGLFRKRSTEFRVAAVRALGDARTPGAIVALRRRLEDKEREVREAAELALERATAAERSGPTPPPGVRRQSKQRGPTR